jgi:hypothetical protein
MIQMKSTLPFAFAVLLLTATGAGAEDLPPPIQAPGMTPFLTLHAEGAQIYQCKAGSDGALAWSFREPVATLLREGATVGRHFAGPSWRLDDGGQVQGKVVGKAPGASPADAAWLKLEATAHEGQGLLSEAVVIQRIHTQGGALAGACEKDGVTRSVAYAADYVFLKK